MSFERGLIPDSLVLRLTELSTETAYLLDLANNQQILNTCLQLINAPGVETKIPGVIQVIRAAADDPILYQSLLTQPAGSAAWLLYHITPNPGIEKTALQSLVEASQNHLNIQQALFKVNYSLCRLLKTPQYEQDTIRIIFNFTTHSYYNLYNIGNRDFREELKELRRQVKTFTTDNPLTKAIAQIAGYNLDCTLRSKSRLLITELIILSINDMDRIRTIAIQQVLEKRSFVLGPLVRELTHIKTNNRSSSSLSQDPPGGLLVSSLDKSQFRSEGPLPILNYYTCRVGEHFTPRNRGLSLEMLEGLATIPDYAQQLCETTGLVKALSDILNSSHPTIDRIEEYFQINLIVTRLAFDAFTSAATILGHLLQRPEAAQIQAHCTPSLLLTHLSARGSEAVLSDISEALKFKNKSNAHISHTVKSLSWISPPEYESTIFILSQIIKRLPTCIQEDNTLTMNLLPLLERPHEGTCVAEMLIYTVKTYPAVISALKTPESLDNLIRQYTNEIPKAPSVQRALYILLKYALGTKSMGQWTADLSVRPLLNTAQIQERLPALQNTTGKALRKILSEFLL